MIKRNNDDDNDNLNASKVSDWVKKTLLTGVGAALMTEEGIRNALGDLKMPKNVITAAVLQADKTKKEIITLIAREVRQFLDRVEVADIVKKAMAGQTIEIKATITFPEHKEKKKSTRKSVSSDDEE